jgi:phage baseplate assembly protein W
MSYSPKLPLQIDTNNNFISIKDAIENAKQNIKMILLTNPGEKIYNPNFGIGVIKFLFKQSSELEYLLGEGASSLFASLRSQLYQYNPEITLEDLSLKFEENYMHIKILFSYLGFSSNEVTVDINLSGL